MVSILTSIHSKRVTLSDGMVGAILYALEHTYAEDSLEIQYIAQPLYDAVYMHLAPLSMYDDWVQEFKLRDKS